MSDPDLPKKLISSLLNEDPGFLDIVQDFVNSLDQRIQELRAAHEALDWDTMTMLAHRLKGAGGSYGYPDLSALGKEMEQHFQNHVATHFSAWISQLSELTAAAKAGLP